MKEERHLMGFRWGLVPDLSAGWIVYHFSFSLVNVALAACKLIYESMYPGPWAAAVDTRRVLDTRDPDPLPRPPRLHTPHLLNGNEYG